MVFGKIPKKYHVECESSLPDGKIAIRLFEYDAQIALDEGVVTEETLTVTFPNTAVLYLRTFKKTPDKMKYVIITPGGTVQYDVPIGVGDIMGGALIETEARKILNKGIRKKKKETALRMLKRGKMTVEEIAEDSGLSVAEVEQLAGLFVSVT